MDPHHIHIDEYDYPLPDERIAKYPLAERDASQLLVYRNGQIHATAFRRLSDARTAVVATSGVLQEPYGSSCSQAVSPVFLFTASR